MAMIGYATLGTNDIARGSAFYDALRRPCGASRLMELEEGFVLWGASSKQSCLAIAKPYDRNKLNAFVIG